MTELKDITDVIPISENDAPLIDEIVEVLKKHSALNRFGLTLLHQHFPIGEDEILVETTDMETRTQTIKPLKKSEAFVEGETVTETSWRLDTGKAMMMCICKPINGHGHYPNNSDRKLKAEIEPVENVLSHLVKLNPTSYFFKTEEFSSMQLPKHKQFGLIAQEVEKLLPDLVYETVSGGVEHKSVNYQGLIALLLQGLKEQNKHIASLEERFENLKTEFEYLKMTEENIA